MIFFTACNLSPKGYIKFEQLLSCGIKSHTLELWHIQCLWVSAMFSRALHGSRIALNCNIPIVSAIRKSCLRCFTKCVFKEVKYPLCHLIVDGPVLNKCYVITEYLRLLSTHLFPFVRRKSRNRGDPVQINILDESVSRPFVYISKAKAQLPCQLREHNHYALECEWKTNGVVVSGVINRPE